MKITKFSVASALLAVLLAAPSHAQSKAAKPARVPSATVPMPASDRIAMADFKKLLADNNVVVLDVRNADAYQSGHIPGALSVPEETITPALAEKLKRMGKPVAIYCS